MTAASPSRDGASRHSYSEFVNRALMERHQAPLFYASTVLVSLSAGMLVARNQQGTSMLLLGLLALAWTAVLVSLPAHALVLGWLFLAPLFQSSADGTAAGRALTWALYIAPALIMLGLTLLRRERVLEARVIDYLPGAYVAYVIASLALTSDMLQTSPMGSLKAIFTILAIGPVVYYFLTFGPGVQVSSERIVGAIMVAGIVQGVLALVDAATGWNPWGDTAWQGFDTGSRAVATLGNPAVLGMLLGVAIACAVATLAWRRPGRLRGVSWVVLVICTPGLLATLTRGPIVATALAVLVPLVLVRRTRVLGASVLAVGAVALAFLAPSLQRTEVYQERVAQRETVQTRVALQDWSLRLAAQKPVLGWGYGSFDRVKNTSEFSAEGIPIASVLEATSHDTYLTILVELGLVGLLLLLLPFAIATLRVIASRPHGSDDWLVATSLCSLFVIGLTASTLDYRFFSFAQMLPFVFLGLLRRMLGNAPRRDRR
jgi:O-antigen ligase